MKNEVFRRSKATLFHVNQTGDKEAKYGSGFDYSFEEKFRKGI